MTKEKDKGKVVVTRRGEMMITPREAAAHEIGLGLALSQGDVLMADALAVCAIEGLREGALARLQEAMSGSYTLEKLVDAVLGPKHESNCNCWGRVRGLDGGAGDMIKLHGLAPRSAMERAHGFNEARRLILGEEERLITVVVEATCYSSDDDYLKEVIADHLRMDVTSVNSTDQSATVVFKKVRSVDIGEDN